MNPFIGKLIQALDYLAIGIHELANMSERRIERLVNKGIKTFPKNTEKTSTFRRKGIVKKIAVSRWP